jgi:hypothetical protein
MSNRFEFFAVNNGKEAGMGLPAKAGHRAADLLGTAHQHSFKVSVSGFLTCGSFIKIARFNSRQEILVFF